MRDSDKESHLDLQWKEKWWNFKDFWWNALHLGIWTRTPPEMPESHESFHMIGLWGSSYLSTTTYNNILPESIDQEDPNTYWHIEIVTLNAYLIGYSCLFSSEHLYYFVRWLQITSKDNFWLTPGNFKKEIGHTMASFTIQGKLKKDCWTDKHERRPKGSTLYIDVHLTYLLTDGWRN